MKIMVFLHGTLVMHKSGLGKSRDVRVKQSTKREKSVLDYANYVPVGNAVKKLKNWVAQGAKIVYLSSHESKEDVNKDKLVLKKYNFPTGPIYWRNNNQSYATIAENLMPDILIEDDCESIGGEIEMTYPHINPKKQKLIKPIVIKEFEGIDKLSDDINELLQL